jgi:hypothetical protein
VKTEQNCSHTPQRKLERAYQEQYFQDAVEIPDTRQIIAIAATENSHGIDPDYRCAGAVVRWRRILGTPSRSLVMN